MRLASGTRIGPFEVLGPLGSGGMGEVYRARDPRLRRDVAVKIIPAEFSRDPERLRRFQQEARAAAALSHPSILAIHAFGDHEGSPYIVTELLEGETLRSRLNRERLPVEKATEMAEQVARGLTAAHEKGIVHRDLKPENIFITRDGRTKILDFGLAKLTPAVAFAETATRLSETATGQVLGTVGYMSPEQVRGETVDPRSDLFSFGAILYEMLWGRRAFQGTSPLEIMNAILKDHPPQHVEAGDAVSQPLARVVSRCLEKEPAERFQSASDTAFALNLLSHSPSSSKAVVEAPRALTWRRRLRIGTEAAVLGAALFFLMFRHPALAPPLRIQAAILPPQGDGFWADITQPAAISPDGKFLALIAMRDGHTQLWLRPLDASEAQPIAGSEDARYPFWSPDSRHIAFFVPGKLKKVDVSGGAVADICQAGSHGIGGAWSKNGVIVFATFADTLKQVTDTGGVPEAIPGTRLSNDAIGQLSPAFLPDGNHFLYLEWKYPNYGRNDDGVWLGSLTGEKPRRLPLTSTNVQYSAGYLLFMHDSDLVAQKFDTSRLELSGAASPVARNVEYDTFLHLGMFTAADTGALVYGTAGTGVDTQLTWFDRTGTTGSPLGRPDHLIRQAISPDGSRVAVGVKPITGREKIWIYDVDRGTRIPLENDESGGASYSPVWSPDGQLIAYRRLAGKSSRLLVRASDGSGNEKAGFEADLITVTSWSPDGRYIATNITKYQGKANWQASIRIVNAHDLRTTALEIQDAADGQFSFDGHWLAYVDKDSGDVYVTPFPGPGARIAVSSSGGGDPRWRGDGQELFYVTDDQTLFSVEVRESARAFRVVSSHPLFRLPLPTNVGFYDVARDGRHFLVSLRTTLEKTAPLTVVTKW